MNTRHFPSELANGSLPVLLLHGFAGDPALWAPIVESLRARGIRCHAARLPGHREGPMWRGAPVDAWRECVESLVQAASPELGPGPWTWAGYSLGGRIAMAATGLQVDRVASAVVISAHPGLQTDAERAARRAWEAGWRERMAVAAARPAAISALWSDWGSMPLFSAQQQWPQHLRAQQDAWRRRHSLADLQRIFADLSLSAMPDWRADLNAAPFAIHWVTGADDEKYTELARQAARPGYHTQITGAGHNVVVEAPDTVANVIWNASKGREQHEQ